MSSFAKKRQAFQQAQEAVKTVDTAATRAALDAAARALSESREMATARRDLRRSIEQHRAVDRREGRR